MTLPAAGQCQLTPPALSCGASSTGFGGGSASATTGGLFGGGACTVAAGGWTGVDSGSTFSNIGDDATGFEAGGGFAGRDGCVGGGKGVTVVERGRSCTGAVATVDGAAVAADAGAQRFNSWPT